MTPTPKPAGLRLHRFLAPTLVGLLALTACGQSAPQESSSSPTTSDTATSAESSGPADGTQDDITLRISTWGSDARVEMTREAIDLFEAANPHITVSLENTPFGSYWDVLATQMAAGDAPDVIQLDEVNFGAYAGRDALLDLAGYSDVLQLTEMSEGALATGEFNDTQYGVPMGLTSLAIAANVDLFEKAGVELPDDSTWTWEEFEAVATELSDNLDSGEYGIYGMGLTNAELILWARQHGEEVFPQEGDTPLSEATVAAYFDQAKALVDSGAAPEVSLQVENTNSPLEATLLATQKAALGFSHTSQLASFSRAAGTDLQLLRAPGVESGQHHMASTASQWTINRASEHADEAAQLIAFIMGDPEAAEILTTERGIPALASVRSQIEPLVDSASKVTLDFATTVEDEMVAPSNPAPAGGGTFNADFTTIAGEVLFDQTTSEDGARRLIEIIAGYSD